MIPACQVRELASLEDTHFPQQELLQASTLTFPLKADTACDFGSVPSTL
jgi:hypothetical protein